MMSTMSARQRSAAIKLDPVTPELLREITSRIVHAISPDRVILFGSHARGSAHEYSDIDLLIVKAGTARPREVVEKIYGLFWDRSVELDVFVTSPDRMQRELTRGNLFLRDEVLRRGTVLYERHTSG